jgi:POLQ-like helicase
MRGLNLADDVHLVFLCTPADPGLPLPPFSDALWERIFAEHGQVVGMITGWSGPEMQRFVILACAGRAAPSEIQRRELEKLFAACVLTRIIEERQLAEIEREFKVDRGNVQALQVTAAALAGQAVRFAEEMGFHVLAVALGTILKRLSFAVKSELIDLMTMPSMRRDIARVLFDAGFKNPEDVRELSVRELAAMVPHQEGGMTEEDVEEVVKKVIEEADALVEQMALLERFEEESTWKKVMRMEDE